MSRRDGGNTAQIRRLLELDAPQAPAGTTAVLLVDYSSTTCSHCRYGARSDSDSHTLIAGYGRADRRGCGARFTGIGTTYRLDDDWRRALTEMRPDLPIVDFAKRWGV